MNKIFADFFGDDSSVVWEGKQAGSHRRKSYKQHQPWPSAQRGRRLYTGADRLRLLLMPR